MTCDLVAEIASHTGWAESAIYDMPLHRALYYQLKSHLTRGLLAEWLTD